MSESYKEKRKEFIEPIRFNNMSKDREFSKTLEVDNIRKGKVYKAKKSYRANSDEKQRKSARKKLAKSITRTMIGILAVGTIGVSAVKVKEYKEDKNAITLEQALENGKTLEDLSVSEETIKDMNYLEEKLNKENLTYEELIELAAKFPNLQKRIIKEKIGNEIDVPATDIVFVSPDKNPDDIINTGNEGESYTKRWSSDAIFGKKTVASDITKYRDEIIESQNMESSLKAGEVSMNEAKEFYQKAIDKIHQVVAWEISTDEKGNIKVDKIQTSELEKDDGFERE